MLHLRLAVRLREHAAEAVALGARVAAAELEGHAAAVEADYDAIRRVARALRATASRFAGQEERYPIAAIWCAAAEVASKPLLLRNAPKSPIGLGAVAPEVKQRIHSAATRARAKRSLEQRRATSRKAAVTRARRGHNRSGEHHHACRLSDREVLEMRRLWDGGRGPTQGALAELFHVSRELVGKIVRGQLRKTAGRAD